MKKKLIKAQRIKINGKYWRIMEKSKIHALGYCDYKNRIIQLNPTLGPFDLTRTVLHEIIHARLPDIEEEAVTSLANLQAKAITLVWKEKTKKKS